jgi:hypothetical protein
MKINIKAMRSVHLYLGVFFAPLLLFFLISGCWQTFNLHEASEDGSYHPPAIIKSLSQVHKNQRWVDHNGVPQPSIPLRYLIVFMSIGLLVSTVLGIVMAFKYTREWIVWVLLFIGTVTPCFLLWLGRR